MAKRTNREPEQFEYRVRKTVDCIVTVEAHSQDDADELVKSESNWVDERDIECADWEVHGRAS